MVSFPFCIFRCQRAQLLQGRQEGDDGQHLLQGLEGELAGVGINVGHVQSEQSGLSGKEIMSHFPKEDNPGVASRDQDLQHFK